jgi:NAD(P)-dependent dehydrogenase (short-subunit alcohol dehydrogenase family)
LIDVNPRFYSQMGFDIARGLPLPMLVWHAARGEDDRVEAELERARADLEARGMTVLAEPCDVADRRDVERFVGEVARRFGGVDVLAHLVGGWAGGEALHEVGVETWDRMMDLNLRSAFLLCRAVLPGMRARGSGRIVFVNAIGGLLNTPYLGAYTVSKHALDCLAATLDIELRPFGIRVSSVFPSAFQTDMAENLMTAFDGPYEAAARAYHGGLLSRMAPDLTPVLEAIVEAATAPDPPLRSLVAPHLSGVLGPLIDTLDELHQRELANAPQL